MPDTPATHPAPVAALASAPSTDEVLLRVGPPQIWVTAGVMQAAIRRGDVIDELQSQLRAGRIGRRLDQMPVLDGALRQMPCVDAIVVLIVRAERGDVLVIRIIEQRGGPDGERHPGKTPPERQTLGTNWPSQKAQGLNDHSIFRVAAMAPSASLPRHSRGYDHLAYVGQAFGDFQKDLADRLALTLGDGAADVLDRIGAIHCPTSRVNPSFKRVANFGRLAAGPLDRASAILAAMVNCVGPVHAAQRVVEAECEADVALRRTVDPHATGADLLGACFDDLIEAAPLWDLRVQVTVADWLAELAEGHWLTWIALMENDTGQRVARTTALAGGQGWLLAVSGLAAPCSLAGYLTEADRQHLRDRPSSLWQSTGARSAGSTPTPWRLKGGVQVSIGVSA